MADTLFYATPDFTAEQSFKDENEALKARLKSQGGRMKIALAHYADFCLDNVISGSGKGLRTCYLGAPDLLQDWPVIGLTRQSGYLFRVQEVMRDTIASIGIFLHVMQEFEENHYVVFITDLRGDIQGSIL
ncbi:hypothetical protein ACJX0J_025399, partial [Zea mays]